jgi:uncharacterized protein YbjT (DUF2867 family)
MNQRRKGRSRLVAAAKRVKKGDNMYAITGITGKVGGAAAEALLEAGLPVRAVLRDAEKAKRWSARGCEIALAELTDPEGLAAAFAGTAAVFAMKPSIFDPSPGFTEAERYTKAMHTALLKSMPAKVVALSTIGADSDRPNLLSQFRPMEAAMSTLPIPVTFLRAAWFMENAALDVAAARETGVIQSYLQPVDRKIPMIATDDVGRTAAELMQEQWSAVRVVELEAMERVSPNEIARAFAKALGRNVTVRAVPRTSWEEIFRAEGMKNPRPRMQMVDGFNEGWIDFSDKGSGARKGRIGIDAAIAALTAKER